MAKSKKIKPTVPFLKSIKIICPNLAKEVDLVEGEYYIGVDESECELCGSHGEVYIEVEKCPCGLQHERIEIRRW